MLELERHILNRNPLWRDVLQQYIAAHEHARRHDPEHDGWTGRQTDHDGLSPEEQSEIHGRLIALGLIRFQIADRTAGMRYQVTGLGRSVLQAWQNEDGTDADQATAGTSTHGTAVPAADSATAAEPEPEANAPSATA